MFKYIDGSLKLVTLAHSLNGPMFHTKSHGNWPSGSGEDYFKDFFHIYVWRPSCSCDYNNLHK